MIFDSSLFSNSFFLVLKVSISSINVSEESKKIVVEDLVEKSMISIFASESDQSEIFKKKVKL